MIDLLSNPAAIASFRTSDSPAGSRPKIGSRRAVIARRFKQFADYPRPVVAAVNIKPATRVGDFGAFVLLRGIVENAAARDEERDELTRWLAGGWVDTFRRFNPDPGHYSWWSPQAAARARNIGWRLDYVLACPAAAAYVRSAAIHPEVTGSDHCPVSVAVDPAIMLPDPPGLTMLPDPTAHAAPVKPDGSLRSPGPAA